MKLSIGKILTAAIAVIILTLTAVLFISARQSHRVSDTSKSVEHTVEILLHLQKLVFSVLDNETSVRGLIITGKEEFIAPLKKSETGVYRELSELNSLINHPQARQWLSDSLTPSCNARLDFSRKMIETYRRQGREAASALVLSGQGRYYTDQIRATADKIETLETRLLRARRESNDQSIKTLNIILYSVLGVSLLLAIISIERIRSGVKRQNLNEQKFSALLDAAPDAMVIVNEKGIIQMINQQTENLFGYSRNELLNRPVEIMIPKELRERHVHHRSGFFQHARVRPMGAGIELNAIRKDGTSFPVEISLSPIQTRDGLLVSASIRDITDRKKSEEKFRSLLDSAPDATVIVNEKGVIQMINHQTENLFEYTRNELIGKSIEILIPAELRDKHMHHRADFSKTPRIRTMGAGLELNAIKKSGLRFPVEISLSPIETEEGMLISASVRDISARKKLEDELKKSSSEMEAFTYSVSHDLRAPLRGIIGFTAILEEDYASKLDDEARRITSVIRQNTLKMGHLIDDLLAFSRTGKQELVKTKVNTKSLVNDTIEEFMQDKDRSGIAWDVRSLPPVNADVNTLRQVWVNLISNAIKYSSHRPDPHIEIGSYFQDAHAVFYVRDNGVGFDEQYKHKLFKVFQRLHSAEEFEGTGVGLALIEKIVARHGGKVWAEGKTGEGACFYFSLPI